MRRAIFILIGLAVLSAGCTAQDSGEDGEGPALPDRPDVQIQSELPEWSVGQGWRYVMDVPGFATQTTTLMVAEDHGDLWVVAAEDREQSLHDALFSLSPFLGRNGKATLAPFQGGEPVQMYDFPLEDGKTWEAPFFGETMTFEAELAGDIRLQPSLGLGDFAEGFRITATGSSGRQVHFDYVDAVEWFTRFEVLEPNGERSIRFDLLDTVDDYQGPYAFFRGEDLLIERFASESAEPVLEEVQVPRPERSTDGLALAVSYVGSPSNVPPVANVSLVGPPGEGPVEETTYSVHEFTSPGHARDKVDVDVDPGCLEGESCEGPLRVELRLVGDVEVEIRLVGYQVFAEGELG